MSKLAATIELEHSIGFTGEIQNSIYFHPNNKECILISGGCIGLYNNNNPYLTTIIVICDLSDPHNQEFLRGHDDDISCLAITKSVQNSINTSVNHVGQMDCIWSSRCKR